MQFLPDAPITAKNSQHMLLKCDRASPRRKQTVYEKLLAALARAAELHISDFKPQEIANTAWAFATLG